MNPRCSRCPWRASASRVPAALLVLIGLAGAWAADAPKPAAVLGSNDVVAFVGGEDVVAFQGNGYLELLLTTALKTQTPRFRYLAVEGDTVFEQARQLNFPPWEDVLRRVGATVVVCQFGQAESLKGSGGRVAFASAYEKLIDRLGGRAGMRRVILVSPTPFEAMPDLSFEPKGRNSELAAYVSAVRDLARKQGHTFIDVFHPLSDQRATLTRDGIHLNAAGHWMMAREVSRQLGLSVETPARPDPRNGALTPPPFEALRQAIVGKNRLWFDYWRPQNWAFLHGDRTEQASSRDHRDPKVRWFPVEMEKFLPLIAAKEQEIATLVKK